MRRKLKFPLKPCAAMVLIGGLIAIFSNVFVLFSPTTDTGFITTYKSVTTCDGTFSTDASRVCLKKLSDFDVLTDDELPESNRPTAGECFLSMTPFIFKLLEYMPGFVIDASEDKACHTLVPKQRDRKVYSFLSTPWQRALRTELSSSPSVQTISRNDTHGMTIDTLIEFELRHRALTTQEIAVIFIGGDANHTLRMVRGAEETLMMHDAPVVMLRLENGGNLAGETMEIILSHGFRLFMFAVHFSSAGGTLSGIRQSPAGVDGGLDLLLWAQMPLGLNREEFEKFEILSREIKPLGEKIESEKIVVEILAIRTSSISRKRDRYWTGGAWWDIDDHPSWWQFSPAKNTARKCRDFNESKLRCNFVPLRLAFVVAISENSQHYSAEEISTWWERFPPCAIDGKKFGNFIDLIIRADFWNMGGESVPSLTGTQINFQKKFLEAISPYRFCFNAVRFDWVPKKHANTDGDLMMLMPLFALLRSKFDYFFYYKSDSTPIKKFWLDSLYEDLLVTPFHFWVKTSLRTSFPYFPDTRHAAQAFKSEEEKLRIVMGNFERSAVGFYRVGDEALERKLHLAFLQFHPQTFEGILTYAPKAGDVFEWQRSAHNWIITETLADSPPAFELVDVDNFLRHNPSVVIITNLIKIRRLCLGLTHPSENQIDYDNRKGVCGVTTTDNFCRGCEFDAQKYFDPSLCEHCTKSLTAPVKHQSRSCVLDTAGASSDTTSIICDIPKEHVCLVMPINHNLEEPEIFELLGNWTGDQYPCNRHRKFKPNLDLYFRAVPEKDRDISDERHKQIAKILQESQITENCFSNVNFEDVNLPEDGQNDYKWATCSNFFPIFFEKRPPQCTYILFTEEDVTPIQRHWLDTIFEMVSLTPEHFWQIGSLARYQSRDDSYDDHRNGVALYRVGDPWFDALLEDARKSCPGAHDRMLDATITRDPTLLTRIWGKFPVSEFHQNCPPAFELQDREWFQRRYPNTLLVHKFNRITLRLCPTRPLCQLSRSMGGFDR